MRASLRGISATKTLINKFVWLINMLKFYRDVAIGLLVLMVLTILLLYLGWVKSQLNASLFPARDPQFLWMSATEPRKPDGKTRLDVKGEVGTVEYDFFLDPAHEFPYTHYSIYFVDPIQSFAQVDLTR